MTDDEVIDTAELEGFELIEKPLDGKSVIGGHVVKTRVGPVTSTSAKR